MSFEIESVLGAHRCGLHRGRGSLRKVRWWLAYLDPVLMWLLTSTLIVRDSRNHHEW